MNEDRVRKGTARRNVPTIRTGEMHRKEVLTEIAKRSRKRRPRVGERVQSQQPQRGPGGNYGNPQWGNHPRTGIVSSQPDPRN